MFESMHKECKQLKEKTVGFMTNDSLNKYITAAKKINVSPLNEKSSNLLNLNGNNKSQKSPIVSKRIGVGNPQIVITKNQEDIYKKLYKVKYEGLFKRDYEKDQLDEEIKKILTPAVEEMKEKKIGKPKMNLVNNEQKAINDYPIKQEKYTRTIF